MCGSLFVSSTNEAEICIDCSTAVCMDSTNMLWVSKDWVQQGLNRMVNVAGFLPCQLLSVFLPKEKCYIFSYHIFLG